MSSDPTVDANAALQAWTRRILRAGEGSGCIRHMDGAGRPVATADDVRHDPDAGIDLVTVISARNGQAVSRVRNAFEVRLQQPGG